MTPIGTSKGTSPLLSRVSFKPQPGSTALSLSQFSSSEAKARAPRGPSWVKAPGDATTIRRVPLYVYKREDGSTVEIQHSIHDEALTVCPETGQRMERVPQAFGSAQLPNRFYSEGMTRKGTP